MRSGSFKNVINKMFLQMGVVHRIRWWRLHSSTHLRTRRWLRSPSLEAQSVVMITAEAALRCLSLAAVSFWHRASSKLAAALWTEPHHFGQSMAYPSRSLRWMWHHWRLALTVSLYCSFSLVFFSWPGIPCTSGVLASNTPPFESRVQSIEVGPWWWWPLCWWI